MDDRVTNAHLNDLLVVSPSSSSATAASASATTSTTAAAESNKFSRLWVDNLLGLGEDGHEVLGFGSITGSEQGVACASVAFTSSTTNSVNVVLAVVGVVVIDDELDIIHVKTTGGDIGGYE